MKNVALILITSCFYFGFQNVLFGEDPAKDTIPALIEALKHEDYSVRHDASAALVKIGRPAVIHFIKTLEKMSEDPTVEYNEFVIWTLAQIGPEAEEAIPALLKLVKKGRRFIMSNRVMYALGKIGPKAVPTLIEVLRDDEEDRFVRNDAAWALGDIGPAAKDAIPLLIKILKDKKNDIRGSAAQALANIGSSENDIPILLIEILKDKNEDEFVRANAVHALTNIRPATENIIAVLIEALKDKNKCVRRASAAAFGRIEPGAEKGVPALIEALKDEDESVRNDAAWALGDIGPAVKDAIPHLIEALKEEGGTGQYDIGHVDVHRRAMVALSQIGPAAIPALIEALLKDKRTRIRHGVALVLSEIGPAAEKGVPALIEALEDLEDVDGSVRNSAALALGKIGPAAKDAIPPLIKALLDKAFYYHHQTVAYAISEIGLGAEDIPIIVSVLKDKTEDIFVRRYAIIALVDIGPDSIDALNEILKDEEDEEIRKLAKSYLLKWR